MEQTINSNNNVFHINNFIVIYFKNNIRRDKLSEAILQNYV